MQIVILKTSVGFSKSTRKSMLWVKIYGWTKMIETFKWYICICFTLYDFGVSTCANIIENDINFILCFFIDAKNEIERFFGWEWAKFIYFKGIYYLNENNPATGFSVPVCLQITNIFRWEFCRWKNVQLFLIEHFMAFYYKFFFFC